MTKTMKKNGKKRVKKADRKKSKDPKRVEAAKKAWATIRARTKEKQATNKLDQPPELISRSRV